MLKSLARVFEFKEASISKGTLRRILILMVLSLPAWPIKVLDYHGMLPDNGVGKTAIIAMFIGMVSMLFFVCTRFVNRFYFPDKYLDEWEIRIKHKSMTFAFMVMAWVFAPLILIFVTMQDLTLTMSGEAVGLWGLGALLVMVYLQTFHALLQVRPMDED